MATRLGRKRAAFNIPRDCSVAAPGSLFFVAQRFPCNVGVLLLASQRLFASCPNPLYTAGGGVCYEYLCG